MEACPFWPMIRVRSGWISREDAGLKAHDEVNLGCCRLLHRAIAIANALEQKPALLHRADHTAVARTASTLCYDATGDDLVIRNNADAFSDNSSRINVPSRQGFQPAASTSGTLKCQIP